MTIDYEKLGVFYLGRTAGTATPEPLLYDSRDLTTHAVCVGMTGSGKTGLCLSLLEEAAIDGIPALCIDPKGDLGNLLLAFPELRPEDFAPWIDPADAARKNVSVDELAASTAAQWKKGLADWDQPPERIRRFRDAVDIAIYTPGSDTGLPLSVLRSFDAPAEGTDATATRERAASLASGLLCLLDRDADRLQSREHILLATLFETEWREGRSPDLAALIGAVQKPPLDKVGAFDLETFFPAKDRLSLAMALNNLLASPGFSAWMTGEPLDVQRLLFTPEGKPRLTILSIAHLGDSERMFIVTLVLNELIAWMRRQSGTGSLRALLYMDEIFGYFPPSANPPSKPPMLTLLKQARAFGLGCVLSTQNPVDLDYKGLSNAGTWFVGRLQTERDKQRLIDGLESAQPGTGDADRQTLGSLLAGLEQRTFLMRNVHDDGSNLMKSRWALSYLRGPLTGPEIARLMAPRKAASSAQRAASPAAAAPMAAAPSAVVPAVASRGETAKPSIAPDVREYFIRPTPGDGSLDYRPLALAQAKLHFVDAKSGTDDWRTVTFIAPFDDEGKQVSWADAQTLGDLNGLDASAVSGAAFSAPPASVLRAQNFAAWGKALATSLYQTQRATLQVARALGLASKVGESEADFRARLALAAREKRDASIDALRRKYAPKIQTMNDQLRRATDRAERERSQLSEQKMASAVSIGSAIFGALLGRKRVTATNVGRAASAVRSASRIGRESGDVTRAEDSIETVRARLAALESDCEREIDTLGQSFDPATLELEALELAPRKSDISVGPIAVAWAPWRRGADGLATPAYVLSSPRG